MSCHYSVSSTEHRLYSEATAQAARSCFLHTFLDSASDPLIAGLPQAPSSSPPRLDSFAACYEKMTASAEDAACDKATLSQPGTPPAYPVCSRCGLPGGQGLLPSDPAWLFSNLPYPCFCLRLLFLRTSPVQFSHIFCWGAILPPSPSSCLPGPPAA